MPRKPTKPTQRYPIRGATPAGAYEIGGEVFFSCSSRLGPSKHNSF